MPSNESPAFDVLTASGDELYLHAMHDGRSWQWSLVKLRSDIVGALQKPGTPEMALRESQASEAERDTDLARARREGIREGLTALVRHAEKNFLLAVIAAEDIIAFRDQNYPAPKPAECYLSDGSVVRYLAERGALERSYLDKHAAYHYLSDWPRLLTPTDTGTDFDDLKAFAATRTEVQ